MTETGGEKLQCHSREEPIGGGSEGPATKHFWDFKASHWATAILTFGILIVGAVQACIYFRQAGIMQTQVDLTAEQNRISTAVQRAFVVISDFTPVPIGNDPGPFTKWQFSPSFENAGATGTESLNIIAIGPRDYDGVVRAIEFWANVRNISKGPVYKPMEYRQYLIKRDWKIGAPPDPSDIPIADVDANMFSIPNASLGPKQKIPLPLSESYQISIGDTDDAQSDKIGRFFYGVAKYRDVFKVDHVTKYCYRIDGSMSIGDSRKIAVTLCKHWNCVDEQCAEDRHQYDTEVAALPLPIPIPSNPPK